MGWGEPHIAGTTGTTAQIELAHQALDKAGVSPGNLARRAIEAAGMIHRLKQETETDIITITEEQDVRMVE